MTDHSCKERLRMTHLRPFHYLALAGALLLISCVIAGCTAPVQRQTGMEATPSCVTEEIVFLTEEIYPLSYTGTGGTPDGQTVQVIQELSRRLNCSSRIEIRAWRDAYETALAKPGCAVFPTARTPEREREFAWAGPVAIFDYVLYATKDSGIALQSLEAARNAGTIAVVARDARHDFLIGNQFSNVRTYSTDAECLDALMNGSVSLWVGSSATTPETLRRKGIPESALVPVYSLLRTELFIAFNRETAPATVRAYQDTLDAMKADGTFARITGSSTHTPPSPAGAGDRAALASRTLLPALSALIGTRMHGISAAMETLALTGELESEDWDRIRPLLVRLEAEYPEARFWYARPDGSYYTTVDNLTSANLRDRSYFPGVLAGKTSIGTIVLSKSTGKYTAIVAVPVRAEGKVNGILGTSVYCDSLEETLFRDFALPEGYYAFAVDREGMPVMDSLPQRIFSLDENTRSQVMGMKEGQVRYRDEGTPHEAVFMTEDVTGWKVAIGWRA
ncbi:MAG TPA: transporter substrate-binding domain-containing protein [Methanolinea sp.]|nr:transporter substrate-binding domain-containing protein [Methanolinea sp.]